MRQIDERHLQHPFVGARMLRRQVAQEGWQVGRRHVGTRMRRMGIAALAPQPSPSKKAPGHKIDPYLLRRLTIARSNPVWALETTDIVMARGAVRAGVSQGLRQRERPAGRRCRVMTGYNGSREHSRLQDVTPDAQDFASLPTEKQAA